MDKAFRTNREEMLTALKRIGKERDRENEEIDRRFPINPNDDPERKREMEVAREVAKMDP